MLNTHDTNTSCSVFAEELTECLKVTTIWFAATKNEMICAQTPKSCNQRSNNK